MWLTEKQQQERMFSHQDTILTGIVVVFLGVAVFFVYTWYATYTDIQSKQSQLYLVSSYDTTALTQNKATKERFLNRTTLDDIIGTNADMGKEQKRYTEYFESLQSPYISMLENVYLPSLNIWKDAYTHEIDTTLIGERFLEKNPYTDLYLITKWSNFFKDIGNTAQFNEITDINIQPIQEMTDGFFKIPISLSFTAPDKRSFLLLVDKLSMTSNKDNIALINEFIYYVREWILEKKSDFIARQVYDQGAMTSGESLDKKLWYLLYTSIWWDTVLEEPIITEDIIEWAIQKSAGCKQESPEKCYYLFREKFRTIPYLAYTIADRGIDKVQSLQTFLRELPPIIRIQEFTFNEARTVWLKTAEAASYQGKISIEVFGRWIPAEDVDGVAAVLGKQCFEDQHPISSEDAIQQVTKDLAWLSEIDSLNLTKSKELSELIGLLEKIQIEYPWLSNYKKIIRLFEIYRMMDDANICEA